MRTACNSVVSDTHRDPHGIGVVVATRGRAAEVVILLDMLAQGTYRPDYVVIVGTAPSDWAGAETSPLAPVTLTSPPGLPCQRNVGINYLRGLPHPPDVVVFFDDDFRPHPRWLEGALAEFEADSTIVAITGTVLADGAKTAAVDEAKAEATIAAWTPSDHPGTTIARLYGCNMAARRIVFDSVRFDERLPLYAWLEDLDFTEQLVGRRVLSTRCGGVHLGVKGARVSGVRFGYSQIINPLYLARKGTCPKLLAARLVLFGLLSNLLRSKSQHPIFDYRGRLRGNFHALADLARGCAAPERIAQL